MHFTTHELLSGGVRLRLHRGGSGPALVFVHGLTDHGLDWSRLMRACAASHTVVCYDSRGHGQSDDSPTDYHLETLADDLLGLVDALALERPVVIGHSMGGSTAAVAAARAPGRFGGVVLEDPVWGSSRATPDDLAALMPAWAEQVVRRRAQDRATLLAEVLAESPEWDAEDHQLWIDSKQAVRPAALGVLPSFARDWLADARSITAPLLVLTGEPERGAIVDLAAGQALLAARPATTVARFAGTGHQVRRVRFADVVALLHGWLAHPGAGGALAL